MKFKQGDRVELLDNGRMKGLTGVINNCYAANAKDNPLYSESRTWNNIPYYEIVLDKPWTFSSGAVGHSIGRSEREIKLL